MVSYAGAETVHRSRVHDHALSCAYEPVSQEPGETGRSADVVRETPSRPPGRHSGVLDNVAMNGIKNAMAGQGHNDDPRARLEPGDGRSRVQRHHHRLDDHRL